MLTDRQALSSEPLLSAAEELELARQIEAGLLAQEARAGDRKCPEASHRELMLLAEQGERARQRFIHANLRLVAQAARVAASRSRLAGSDLFQEGCLGLITAVERFDFRRGYRFSTYALFWVRAHLNAATANGLGALGLPTARAQHLRQARGLEIELSQTLGRTATTGEVASELGRSEKWTADLLAHQAPQSFDGLDLDGVEAATASSAWGEPGAAGPNDWSGAELLWQLQEIERKVLSLRYGFADGTAHSLAEVGRKLQISSSKARRVESRALEALRAVCPSGAAVHL